MLITLFAQQINPWNISQPKPRLSVKSTRKTTAHRKMMMHPPDHIVSSAAAAQEHTPHCTPSNTWKQNSPAIHQLSKASPAFQGLLDVQDAAVSILHKEFNLSPLIDYPFTTNTISQLGIDSNGDYHCKSADATSASVIRGYQGDFIKSVSLSAIANPPMNFGTVRLLGWSDTDSCVPHLFFNASAQGEDITVNFAYWPRIDHTSNASYFHEYYNRPDGKGLLDLLYNDILLLYTDFHVVDNVTMLGGPNTQINLRFNAANQDNIELFTQVVEILTVQWVLYTLKNATEVCGIDTPTTSADTISTVRDVKAAIVEKDRMYFDHIASGTGNLISVKLFGAGATNVLIGISTGGEVVGGYS